MPTAAPEGARPRALALAALGGLAASALALLLLGYLHREWQPAWALACGALGGLVLPRLVRATYAGFPPFLRAPFALGVGLLGTTLACLSTLSTGSLPYLVDRWREAGALAFVAVATGLTLASLLHTHGRLAREIGAAREREARSREEALDARLRALQAQIQPHFLFNALNALAELTQEDPARAEQMVGDLAFLLRYGLRSSTGEHVPLARELEAVERYLRVERARFGERLAVEHDVPAELHVLALPGLVLQPLVENAVRHGVAPRAQGGRVRYSASAADGRLHLLVEDDGPGLPDEVRASLERPGARGAAGRGSGGAGGGLANVRERLELAYRGRARLTARRGEWGGTLLEMELPL